jgi:APA family basic amino acid/polyamine antiporter
VRDTTPKPGALLRILGLGFGLAVILGATLGVGILRTPGLVARDVGSVPLILLLWVAGGVYTLLASVCLAELGTALPEAGGYFVYVRRAFGDWAGFAVGWTDWLTYCTVMGYVSIGIAEFTASLFALESRVVAPVALGALLLFTALQWAGLRASSRFQEVATAVKSVAFLLLVAACLTRPGGGGLFSAGGAPGGLPGLVRGLEAVIVTYGGWQSALYFAEEDRDPGRNIPRSMVGGVLLVIVIYVLVNVALLVALPFEALASATLPAADAAARLFGSQSGEIITVLSLLSLLPMINAIMMIGARILFAMGRDGLLWSGSATVSARGMPSTATVASVVVAAVLAYTGTFQKLVGVASFFLAANAAACCLALFRLRQTSASMPRPFRAWGYPWSAAIVLLGSLGFLVGTLAGDPWTGLSALGALAAGFVVRAVYLGSRPGGAAA